MKETEITNGMTVIEVPVMNDDYDYYTTKLAKNISKAESLLAAEMFRYQK